MAYKYREELVGKRFLSLSATNDVSSSDICAWGWKAGVIRAATHKDTKHQELQVLIEVDGVDWQRREWRSVYAKGNFKYFFVESTLNWAPRTNKKDLNRWPALNFVPLVSEKPLNKHPIEYLLDNDLAFLDDAKLLQPFLDWDVLLPTELQTAVLTWKSLQDGQRILTTTPSVLGGCRAKVYRVVGTTQWYTAVIVGYSEHSGELTVTDDTVLEEHSENPSLVQMRLLGDVVESIMRGEVLGVMPRRSRSSLQVNNNVTRENCASKLVLTNNRKKSVKTSIQIATVNPLLAPTPEANKVTLVKRKWKNMRDSYVKEYKAQTKKSKPFQTERQRQSFLLMEFLNPHIKEKVQVRYEEEIAAEEDDITDNTAVDVEFENDEAEDDVYSEPASSESDDEPLKPDRSKENRYVIENNIYKTDIDNQHDALDIGDVLEGNGAEGMVPMLNFVEEALLQPKSSIAAAADKEETTSFFLSLAKTVQRLKPYNQAVIKKTIANLILDAEIKEAQEARRYRIP